MIPPSFAPSLLPPQSIAWETVIVDEAHRMKSTGSSTRQVLTEMHIEWLLLLTGGHSTAPGAGQMMPARAQL